MEGLEVGHGYTDVLNDEMTQNVANVKKEPWMRQKMHRTRKNTFKNGPNNKTMKPTTQPISNQNSNGKQGSGWGQWIPHWN